MRFTRIISNSKGNVFIISLITLAVVTILATSMPSLINSGLQQAKVTRLRSQMRVVETRLRSQLNQPTAFVDCDSQAAVIGSINSCKVSRTLINKFVRNLAPGTKCSTPTSGCGIELFAANLSTTPMTSTPINFNADLPITQISADGKSAKLDLMLKYSGDDVSIQDTLVELHIPFDILQSSAFDCGAINSALPIFVGIGANGKPICRGINDCGPGKFVQSIDPATLEITCGTLSGNPSCGTGEMLSSLDWSSGNVFTHTCVPRLDPYTVFPMDITPTPTPTPTPTATVSPTPSAPLTCPAGSHTVSHFEILGNGICGLGGYLRYNSWVLNLPVGTEGQVVSKQGDCCYGHGQGGGGCGNVLIGAVTSTATCTNGTWVIVDTGPGSP